MYRAPVFIGGPDRCGKTTMRAFLTSHPNIAIPPIGSNMWTYFYGQYGDLGEEGNFERCLGAMLGYKHVAQLQPDVERVRREFWAGEPTYARLFAQWGLVDQAARVVAHVDRHWRSLRGHPDTVAARELIRAARGR